MSRFVRFSGSASARRLTLAVLCACALGCGEDVLVVNWELRSLSDAGLFGEADAGSTNAPSESAEAARDHARDQDDDGHDRPNGEPDKTH
jgi:hypothetical protein